MNPTPQLYSTEAERGLINAVLFDPSVYPLVQDVTPKHFWHVKYRNAWEAVGRCMTRHKTIDPLMLVNELDAIGALQTDGGQTFLVELLQEGGSPDSAAAYAAIIKDKAARRELMLSGETLKQLAADSGLELSDVMAKAQRSVLTATSAGVQRRDQHSRQLLRAELDRIDALIVARQQGEKPIVGLPTGFRDLDKLTGGLQGGDQIVLAGVTGMGKSAFITSLILSMAAQARKLNRRLRVGGFPMEMTLAQYMRRLLSAESGIPSQLLLSGELTPQQQNDLIAAAAIAEHLDLLLDPTSGPTPEYVVSTCQRWQMEGGLDFVFVDYLQRLAVSPSMRSENTAKRVGYAAVSMKNIAQDLNIPVMTAAQLNREVSNRPDKRPILSDLRDSGEIEQEADIVIFLYRDSYYNEASENPNLTDVNIAKHRNGPTGTIPLYFNKSRVRYEEAETRRINMDAL